MLKKLLNQVIKKKLLILIFLLAIQIYIFIFDDPHLLPKFIHAAKLSREEQIDFYWRNFCSQASLIRNLTPQNSLLIIPPRTMDFPAMSNVGTVDYFMFPRHSTYAKDSWVIEGCKGPIFWVSCRGNEYKGEYDRRYILDKDFSLLLLKNGGIQDHEMHLKDYALIKVGFLNMLLALAKLLFVIMSGAWIVARYFKERSAVSFLAVSFLVGSIIFTTLYILLSFLEISFSEIFQIAILLILSIPSLRAILKYRPLRIKGGNFLGVTIVVLLFGLVFLKSLLDPVIMWDEFAFWGLRAKAIFAFHSLKGLTLWGEISNYPPLLPVIISLLAVAGEVITRVLPSIFAFCLYANIYDETKNTKFNPMLKMILPAMVILSPVFFKHSQVLYGNLILTVFVTKLLTILIRLRQDNSYKTLLPFSLFSCGLVLIRPEGSLYFVFLGILAIAICVKRRTIRDIYFIILPVLCYLGWLAYFRFILHHSLLFGLFGVHFYRFDLSTAQALEQQLYNWHTYAAVLTRSLMDALSFKYWGVIVWMFLLILILNFRGLIKKYSVELTFLAISSVCLLIFCYVVLPAWGIEALFEDGFRRYFMVNIPIMFIIVLKEADRLTSS